MLNYTQTTRIIFVATFNPFSSNTKLDPIMLKLKIRDNKTEPVFKYGNWISLSSPNHICNVAVHKFNQNKSAWK
jgi:hypothetical protein